MSRTAERPGDVEGGYLAWRRSPGQPSQADSEFGDSSGPLFSMYSNMAEREDNKMAERWQRDALVILIFTGFFSVVVAVLVTLSIRDLRPNAQDSSTFYLENIYQLLADLDVSNPSTPSLPARPPPFFPPTYAIWVNSLWFLSMAISLTCALLATLLHQWARRYLNITQPVRCSPHKRARIRAFFAEGVESLHVQWAVEALPILLHLSFFSFLAGLLLFLFNVNETVFVTLFAWVALSAGIYACITLMPIFRYDSPYYAPLSSTAWFLYAGILYIIFKVLCFIPRRRDGPDPLRERKDRYRKWTGGGVEKAAEDTAAKRSSKINGRVLDQTTEALAGDEALERFFEAIPGFCDSKEVRVRVPSLVRIKVRQVMDGFLDRTLRSEFLSESVKLARLTNCLNAAHTALGTFAVSRILGNLFDGRWSDIPQSIELGHSLRRWCHSGDEWIALTARSIVAGIIAVQKRDDRWIALVKDEFLLSDRVLRENIPHGDSVLLVILLHVTRNLFHSVLPPWDSNILRLLSRFDIRNTLPHLQRDFCLLWNDIVREARNGRPDSIAVFILKELRRLHVALHGGSYVASDTFSTSTAHADDAVWHPSAYPLCNAVSHRSDPTPHIHRTRTGQSIRTSVMAHSPVPNSGPSSPTAYGIPSFPPPSRRLSTQHPTEPPSRDVADRPQRFFIDTSRLSPSPESQPASPGYTDISMSPLIAQSPLRSSNGVASQRDEETAVVPSSTVSDVVVPPIPMQSISETIPVEPPTTLEPHLHLAPQVDSHSDQPVNETEGVQHDTGSPRPPTPTRMEVSLQPRQSPSVDPAASTPQPEDRQLDTGSPRSPTPTRMEVPLHPLQSPSADPLASAPQPEDRQLDLDQS